MNLRYLKLFVLLALGALTTGVWAKTDGSGSSGDDTSRRVRDVPASYRDPSPFAFANGETVAIIGNGLADRMQHDGWLETVIQGALPDKMLRFRNMSLSGDRVDSFPRSKGFTPMQDYLEHVGPDVVFAFFGYNESFGGESKLDEYQEKIGDLIAEVRVANRTAKVFPRIVLFSPIAHENLNDSNLPDGVENNKRLKLYAEATKDAAAKYGVGYVDLFGPSQKLFAKNDRPLTINGVHLNAEGNRLIAGVIAKAFRLTKAKVALEPLRKAVLAKNWNWHNRYRATDGNDVWGTRSGLSFTDGQDNAEVLQHELLMLDAMTANADKVIWAAAQGESLSPDYGNVPEPIKVITNIGGGSKSSSAEKEGSKSYLSAEEAIANLEVPEGFELNLFADESRFPELVNPVQMQVDGKGRLWAAAWHTYPKWEPLQEMNDALLIFEDDDKDGVADRVIEFAKIHNPLGFEFWNGGVLVTSMPDLWFLKDTDGDDIADVRYVILQGLGSSDTHHSANNLIYGPDGGIYWQSGVFLQHNYEHPWGPSLNATTSAMYRFDPRRHTIAFHAKNSPNPHGIAFDYWGYHFANDGTGGRSYQVRPEGDGFKMHSLLNKEFRPVSADAVISSANFPDEMQDDFLIANVIGFLGVKRYQLHRDGYSATVKEKQKDKSIKEVVREFKTGGIWGTPEEEIIVSSDKNFRPTDVVFGEDGALYVSDWHNVIIGHMQHHVRDPSRDHTHGRIYRLHYTGKPLQEPVAIDGQPITQLLENLKHPVNGVRHRTRVELSERDSGEVIAATKAWSKNFDAKDETEVHHLLEALWLHQQHNVRDMDLLNKVLNSPIAHASIAAKTVQHHWGVADPVTGAKAAPVEEVEEKMAVEVPKHLKKNHSESYTLGAEVYHREAHCATCHQPNGEGLANIYPPLSGTKWVSESPERLIKLTLKGLYGPITVKGTTYPGYVPMTPFHSLLNDEEIAAVLTYVRNSFGNKAEVILSKEVKRVRDATKEKTMFYSPTELLKAHPHTADRKDHVVVYEGESGVGKGKHIVFIASDHEYRTEETSPAIARILAKRYGFKCTVLFGLDDDGHIDAGSSRIPGIEALDTADLMFNFTRFLAPDDKWMKHFDDYINRGGPVLGLRTATHGFNGLQGQYEKYDFRHEGGFGRKILGETWAGHYGKNHQCSTRLDIIPEQVDHPVMRGVQDMHAKAGAYDADPEANSVILANNQVLKTMEQFSEAAENKPPRPAIWVRTYTSESGQEGRVFCSTQGASQDIVNDGFRRCIINGVFWCMGLEEAIEPEMNIDFVGPYHPSKFSFGGEAKYVAPEDLQPWNSPIPGSDIR